MFEGGEMCCLRWILVVHMCMCEVDEIWIGLQDFKLDFSVGSWWLVFVYCLGQHRELSGNVACRKEVASCSKQLLGCSHGVLGVVS